MSKVEKSNKKIKDIEKQCKKKFTIKTVVFASIAVILLFALIGRIGWIMFIKGGVYRESAHNQQTSDRVISPKRGTIYDSTGKQLAISASVDTISINPNLISDKNKEKIATALSQIFELDYGEVYEKVNSGANFKTIIRKVEQSKVNQLKIWMEENEISRGINIDSDSKRYYPYNNLASSLLGFCGTDNQGLYGLEYTLDDVLTGIPGRVISETDGKGNDIPFSSEEYYAPQNGRDLVLSLDSSIQ